MNEQRTPDAQGLLICQHCGVVLKQRSRTCRECGNWQSAHSPTVIPILNIKRKPAVAPQHLKPENDPLLVERVVTRCKFNEAMTPKPKQFHGSRSFLSDNGGKKEQNGGAGGGDKQVAAPTPPAAEAVAPVQSSGNSPLFDDDDEPAPAALAEAAAPVNKPNEAPKGPQKNIFDDMGSSLIPGDEGTRPAPSNAIDASAWEVNEFSPGAPADVQSKSETTVPPQRETSSAPAKPEPAPESKVRKAPLPSYMVADWTLLVVQESDGQTLSMTHTVDGVELPLVFGLFQSPADFNVPTPQAVPESSVALSGQYLSFHDANNEDDLLLRELSVNIDSRLAFEEGLSRVAALRLQGALGRSGVLGFENSNSNDDLRKKFTRKLTVTDDQQEGSASAIEDELAAPVKPKERSVFNPKRAPESESLPPRINPIGDAQPPRAKKNPLALVGAAVGIVLVLAVIGFVAYTKIGSLTTASSNTASSIGTTDGGGGPSVNLPTQWHVVLTRTTEVQTIFQDFNVGISQSGDKISAKGTDQIGAYTLTGEVKGGEAISLQKEYDSAGYIWPIMFSGHLGQGQNGSFASGTYVWNKSQGERIQGEWSASQAQGKTNTMFPPPSNSGSTGVRSGPGLFEQFTTWLDQAGTSNFYQKCAWIAFLSMVGVGGTVYFVFIKLFSPHGKVNRLEKEKYIPSQFRREHARTLKDMPLGQRTEWRVWKFWEKATSKEEVRKEDRLSAADDGPPLSGNLMLRKADLMIALIDWLTISGGHITVWKTVLPTRRV